jgi:hypothetical protein
MNAISFFTSAMTSGPMPSPGSSRRLCVGMSWQLRWRDRGDDGEC